MTTGLLTAFVNPSLYLYKTGSCVLASPVQAICSELPPPGAVAQYSMNDIRICAPASLPFDLASCWWAAAGNGFLLVLDSRSLSSQLPFLASFLWPVPAGGLHNLVFCCTVVGC